MSLIEQIAEGRTELIIDHLASGGDARATGDDGTSLLQWASYYGDVTAIKVLLAQGETLTDLGLNGPAFHGHWRLCQFLIEQGADVNAADPNTGETPLHSALCTTNRVRHNVVLQVLLTHGADPNRATTPGIETGGFMRDSRTKGETPLHRAAAFGDAEAIDMLLQASARKDALDANGDSPLSWGSWYLRPDAILRKLLYGDFRIRPDRAGMEANLTG